jgi:hypothetical protein
MIIQNRALVPDIARQLKPHFNHKIAFASYGNEPASGGVAIECLDCRELLIEFLPASDSSDRQNPSQVRYEGHYDEVRDLCYVEVFKPGLAPYPLQERQDVINHSPTGISWGYSGSGPAQLALAILLDYLGDEQEARSEYQHFKFKVIARLPQNAEWTLTGRQIEQALKHRAQ